MKTHFKTLGLHIAFFILVSCEDKPVPPILSTTPVTEITTASAISGGIIIDDGGAPIISKGICWNTSNDPTIDNSKTIEVGESLSFISNISQLSPNTSYFVRSYAVNSAGTSYGTSVSFKTIGDKPTLNSSIVSEIQTNSVSLNGTVNPNSLPTIVTFEYGLTAAYGNTSTAVQSPVNSAENVNITATLTGLNPGKLYHFRIKAENSLGITYSSDLTFTTLGNLPTALTQAVNNLKVNTVTLTGSVNPNYLSTTVSFEWGVTPSYGNTITLIQGPVTGSATVNVNAELSGILQETTYHYRISATNELGTITGNDQTFTTFALMDADNNLYHSVTIGNQTWMKVNLHTTRYSNGDLIETTDPATKVISGESEPKYQWAYNGNDFNLSVYGRLYTWYVVTDSRNICPYGWHVPSKTEWMTLVDYNGGMATAGLKLKEAGTSHYYPNTGATNESGFTALPGGVRLPDGSFWGSGHAGVFWTITPTVTINYSWTIVIYGDRANIDYSSQGLVNGHSIRCIKD